MIVFDVELLHGTYRADPDGSAATGGHARGEWPPAPSRLLAALMSAGPRFQSENGSGFEDLETLAAAQPPVIVADSGSAVHHQRLLQRYVASQKRSNAQHQEYPARVGTPVRPGVRAVPRSPRVRFVYDLDIDDDTLNDLQWRAARVGYLGCADSPVNMRVARPADALPEDAAAWRPEDAEDSEPVNVHEAGDVARWAAAHEAWRTQGATRRQMLRHQPKAMYRPPHSPRPDPTAGRMLAWLSFASPAQGRKAVLVAHAVKQAAIAHHDRVHGSVPGWVHGHIETEEDYQIARFLPLPFAGHRHADGRIHGAAVWIPPGVLPQQARSFAQTLHMITDLRLADGTDIAVDRSRRSWTTNPRRWRGPAKTWTTVLPAVNDRYDPINAEAVNRWCTQAGLPPVRSCRISRSPLVAGAVDLHPSETARPGRSQRRPYAHVSLTFDMPVQGPVAIGAARSYGLGLCAPNDPPTDASAT